MLLKQSCVVALWAFVPFAVAAQPTPPHPTEPNASVAALRYESAFKAYRASLDDAETPDKVWRSANDLLANHGAHSSHAKDSTAQSITSQDASATTSKQSSTGNHDKHH